MTTPLDRSTTWPYDEAGEPGRYSYARAEQPNACRSRRSSARLEGGRALLFPAGMGAVTGVVLTMLPPGGTIALAEGAYYGHRQLFDHLRPWGVKVVEYDQTLPPPAHADLILIEAPSNPMLTMPDFEAAAAHPAPVVCDATLASPAPPAPARARLRRLAAQRHQGSRGPRRSARRRRHVDRRRPLRAPASDAPADGARRLGRHGWLLERGLKTLEVRLDRMEATAATPRGASRGPRCRHRPSGTPGSASSISFDVADGDAARRVETATG